MPMVSFTLNLNHLNKNFTVRLSGTTFLTKFGIEHHSWGGPGSEAWEVMSPPGIQLSSDEFYAAWREVFHISHWFRVHYDGPKPQIEIDGEGFKMDDLKFEEDKEVKITTGLESSLGKKSSRSVPCESS